jgi:hypothetical protein
VEIDPVNNNNKTMEIDPANNNKAVKIDFINNNKIIETDPTDINKNEAVEVAPIIVIKKHGRPKKIPIILLL